MPRKRQRFEELKGLMLRTLASGGDPTTSTDLELKKFAEWYLRPQDRTPLAAASVRDRQGLVRVAIYPFAFADNAGTTAAVTMSKRSATWLGSQAGLKTASKVITSAPTISAAAVRKGYYPPQAIVKEQSGDAQTQTSRITGRRYKTKFQPSDKGYVIPFGTGADGTDDLATIQQGIQTAVNAIPSFVLTSFIPEEAQTIPDAFVWA